MTPKLICLTSVLNESWFLDRFIQCASIWADHIIIGDQGSTDGSQEIAQKYEKVIYFENKRTGEMNEGDYRTPLFEKARQIEGPKILITLDADEIALVLRDVAGSLAGDESGLPFHGAGRCAHDVADRFRHGGAAHRTGVHRSLAPGDGAGQRVASRVSAGAAVVPRQLPADGYHPLVDLHGEFLPGVNQSRGNQHRDHRDHKGRNPDNIHLSALLKCSVRRSP